MRDSGVFRRARPWMRMSSWRPKPWNSRTPPSLQTICDISDGTLLPITGRKHRCHNRRTFMAAGVADGWPTFADRRHSVASARQSVARDPQTLPVVRRSSRMTCRELLTIRGRLPTAWRSSRVAGGALLILRRRSPIIAGRCKWPEGDCDRPAKACGRKATSGRTFGNDVRDRSPISSQRLR